MNSFHSHHVENVRELEKIREKMENNWADQVLGDGTRDFIRGKIQIQLVGENALIKEELEFGEASAVQSHVQGNSKATFQHGLPPSSTVIGIKVEIMKNGRLFHEIKTKVKGQGYST